jgi:hypothetical protein
MSKYSRLGEFLKDQSAAQVAMTFKEIERLTGHKLPASALQHRAWWSNNPRNSVVTQVWLDAGFESEQVDMASRRLTFRRVRKSPAPPSGPINQPARNGHPLFGALKGLLRIAEGADLTKPANPEWGAR